VTEQSTELAEGSSLAAGRSRLAGGAGAGLLNSVVRVAYLVGLATVHLLHTAASVQLLAEQLVCLYEAIQLTSQVVVLLGQNLYVVLQSRLLVAPVSLVMF